MPFNPHMIPSLKIGIKRPVFYGIVLILVLLVSSPFTINRVINTSYIKNKVSSFIYQKTGTRIDGSGFSISIFPQPSLTIENFNFKADNKIAVNIELLKFNVDSQAFFRGKINISHITIDHPELKPSALKKNHSMIPIDFSISAYAQKLKKIFDFLPGHQDAVEITFKNISSTHFRRMDGSVYLSKRKDIILRTTIKDIRFKASEIPNTSFDKNINADSIELDQLKTIVTLNSKDEIQGQCKFIAPKIKSKNNHILLDSDIIDSVFKLSDDFYQIDIPPFNLNYPSGSVAVHFVNNQIQKKSDIQFIGTNIHIDQAREMSLLFFKENKITRNLFQILNNGTIPKIDVSFQGNGLKDLFSGNHLKLKGTVENGSVHIPKTHLVASRVFGDAHVHDGILEINTNKAMIQSSGIEKGHLSVDLLNYEDHPFQGEFSLDVDLTMMPQTLISLLPDTLLAKELSLVHDVKGRSKAKLNLSLETMPHDLKVQITTANFPVTGKYDRIPGVISLENLRFAYEADTIRLNGLTGMINGSMIYDLNTVLDFKDQAWISIRSGSGRVNLESMIPWLMSYKKTREMLSPVKDGSGKIQIASVDLSGPILKPDQWRYDVTGTGLGIDITTQWNQEQIENLSGQFQLSNDFLSLKKIQAKIRNLSWMQHFIEKKHIDSILVPLDLENGHFHTDTKQSFFKSNLNFTTGPKLHIDLKGETLDLSALNTITFLEEGVSNASISFNYNTAPPLFDFNGLLNTTTLSKVVIPGSYWTKKINKLTQGQPIVIQTDKNSGLTIIAGKLNLNSILPHSGTVSLDNRLLPTKPINFKADKLIVKNLTLTDIDTRVSFKKDDLYIKLNTAFLCDLNIKGHIDFKKDRINGTFPFEARNKANIQDLLTCLSQKNDLIDGRYSLSGNILWDSPSKEVLNQLTGSFILNAEQGRIYKWTLLSRILSVLNVSKIFKGNIPNVTQTGFAYKNISIEADIKDSRIHLTKAVIDGKDMLLIFSGWIDPAKDQMDLTCLVAPFKTVDLIVEKIPVINTLLGGRLISVPVKATGKLFDPVVIPLHPSAVGDGLINIMSNILNTPVKLFDKLSGD